MFEAFKEGMFVTIDKKIWHEVVRVDGDILRVRQWFTPPVAHPLVTSGAFALGEPIRQTLVFQRVEDILDFAEDIGEIEDKSISETFDVHYKYHLKSYTKELEIGQIDQTGSIEIKKWLE